MGIHSRAMVADDVVMGDGVCIGANAVIESGVEIGSNTVIHPNVVIYTGVRIGSGCEVFPGAFIGKEPKGAGAVARVPVFERVIEIGDGCSIGPNAVIFYDVKIGRNTLLGDGASIREKCVVGDGCIISRYVTVNYNTVIGDRTKIMDSTHITGNAIIGDDVFISLMVGTTNDNVVRGGYSDDRIVGPIIEKGAVVGVGASLLPAVRIGAGATVGAGSVVTKDVPPHCVVIGSPARVIRKVE
ncbi:N-acetyltransferase [Chitinilyticum litopenaei]|uniref:N-acetyltransferase n=1 Tax=Chitinilyticum litopenaei TaxID=1121276 RepID=UPI0009DBA1AB|nr:N-acetyltransferase [Chitinilyticum litopenaei]